MADFLQAFERTIVAEGGYKLTSTPGDTGGQTYAGISRKWNPTWHGWAFVDRGETPPTVLVRTLYKTRYWDPLRLDEVTHQRIAESIYDFAVNASVQTSAKLAQLAVGVAPDGTFGPVTLSALNGTSDPRLFMAQFTIAKIARYRDICQRDPSQKKFLVGWLNRALAGAV